MRHHCLLLISGSILFCAGGAALAQNGSTPSSMLTASVGANVGAVSNPSSFSFGSAPSASPTPIPPVSASGVMGYQLWKQNQVDAAKQALDKAQAASPGLGKTSASEIAKNQKLLRLDQRLRQAQLNVEIAQDLTVHDYFLIYLGQFKSKDALVEAAKRLSPEETAELLLSYQHYISRADQIEAPAAGLLTEYGGASNSAPLASNRAALASTTGRASATSTRAAAPGKNSRTRP